MSWRKVKLRDLLNDFSVRARDYGGAENLEFFGVSNEVGITKTKYAAEDKAEDYKIIEQGCLAYNPYRVNVGSIGLVMENIKGLISPAYVVFKPKPNSIKAELLLKFLKSSEGLRQINFYAKGTVRQALRFEDLCNIELSIPDYKEQEILLRKLNTLQKSSSILTAEFAGKLDLIQKLRQQILQDAISGKLTEDWRKENPALEPALVILEKIKAEKERLIKEKKLKIGKSTEKPVSLINEAGVPASWQWCKADDIFFITKLAGFEYTEHISLKKTGDVPVIRAQNVRPLKIDKTNLLFIDEKISNLLERCALTKKCLLVTFIGAGIGDVATFEEEERWHLAPNVAKMEPFEGCEDLINVKYVNYFLMSNLGQNEILKHLKATAQPSLSMGTIRDIDLPFPPLSEQHCIVKKLEQLLNYCDELEKNIKQNKAYTEQLLQVALKEALEPREIGELVKV